jgi:hypothetical protein
MEIDFFSSGLNGYSPPLRTTFFSPVIKILAHGLQKMLILQKPNKIKWIKQNILEIEIFLRLFKKEMQKFQHLVLMYWLESPGFLKEVVLDVV